MRWYPLNRIGGARSSTKARSRGDLSTNSSLYPTRSKAEVISSVAHGRVFRSRMIVRSGLLASAAPANHVRELIDDDDDVMSVIDEVTEPCAALLYHLGTSASPIRLDMCPNGRDARSLPATQFPIAFRVLFLQSEQAPIGAGSGAPNEHALPRSVKSDTILWSKSRSGISPCMLLDRPSTH